MEKHRKNKIIKKRRMRKFVSAESPMMTQDGRLVYFAQQEYQKQYCHYPQMAEEGIQNLKKNSTQTYIVLV